MKIIKKILFGSIISISPLLTFSCSEPLTEEDAIKEVNKIYKLILPTNQSFSKFKVFAPEDWVETNGDNVEYIKEPRKQENNTTFNLNYFNSEYEYSYNSFIKISSKEEFNNKIIKRFKELNNQNDFNEDAQIKALFERLYLNNQDIYEVLKLKDIYIKPFIEYSNYGEEEYLIPFYDNNKVTLNVIKNINDLHRPTVMPAKYNWEVFSINKNAQIIINEFNLERINGTGPWDFQGFYTKISNWYNLEYKKYY